MGTFVNGVRTFPETVVLRWVRLYTLGLDGASRDDRQAEINSDLWEHRHSADAGGGGSATTALSILGRCVAGIPADMSWRLVQLRRRGQASKADMIKENKMASMLGRYWWQTLAASAALGTIYLGIRQFVSDEVSTGISAGKVAALATFLAAGVVTLAGLATRRRMPRRGAVMVMAGLLPMALVGGLGIGLVIGLIASLIGDLGWWWVPSGLGSAIATAAGLGAFSAFWNAAPTTAPTSRRIPVTSAAFVLLGLGIAAIGLVTGLYPGPLVGLGVLIGVAAIAVRSRSHSAAA